MRPPPRPNRAVAPHDGPAGTSPPGAALAAPVVRAASPFDWPQWLRLTERRRRLADRALTGSAPAFWTQYYFAATEASFRLDGLDLPPGHLATALASGGASQVFRSRQQQRVRNHVAILRHIEALLRRGDTLKTEEVVRWYTSIACGLSTTRLDEPTTSRLDGVVRQINSPHLRLRPALIGIARLHRQNLADPLVPSFNGILSRLLLRYHLGRCRLPPVLFREDVDGGSRLLDEQRLLERLLELIHETYGAILGKNA